MNNSQVGGALNQLELMLEQRPKLVGCPNYGTALKHRSWQIKQVAHRRLTKARGLPLSAAAFQLALEANPGIEENEGHIIIDPSISATALGTRTIIRDLLISYVRFASKLKERMRIYAKEIRE